ncbi:hypothetical protein NEUTE2DRAFT_54440 [Neurospora tetrasperma FGSC 2509]|nr:hypothetical protein NEUTE2DRAFT_54440 [Neurospora tetrasperma FGSC 2509]
MTANPILIMTQSSFTFSCTDDVHQHKRFKSDHPRIATFWHIESTPLATTPDLDVQRMDGQTGYSEAMTKSVSFAEI